MTSKMNSKQKSKNRPHAQRHRAYAADTNEHRINPSDVRPHYIHHGSQSPMQQRLQHQHQLESGFTVGFTGLTPASAVHEDVYHMLKYYKQMENRQTLKFVFLFIFILVLIGAAAGGLVWLIQNSESSSNGSGIDGTSSDAASGGADGSSSGSGSGGGRRLSSWEIALIVTSSLVAAFIIVTAFMRGLRWIRSRSIGSTAVVGGVVTAAIGASTGNKAMQYTGTAVASLGAAKLTADYVWRKVYPEEKIERDIDHFVSEYNALAKKLATRYKTGEENLFTNAHLEAARTKANWVKDDDFELMERMNETVWEYIDNAAGTKRENRKAMERAMLKMYSAGKVFRRQKSRNPVTRLFTYTTDFSPAEQLHIPHAKSGFDSDFVARAIASNKKFNVSLLKEIDPRTGEVKGSWASRAARSVSKMFPWSHRTSKVAIEDAVSELSEEGRSAKRRTSKVAIEDALSNEVRSAKDSMVSIDLKSHSEEEDSDEDGMDKHSFTDALSRTQLGQGNMG